MNECGYSWDPYDEYEASGPGCMLEKGHAGPHQATWETRAEDICAAEGHLWDWWKPYVAPEPSPFAFRAEWKVLPLAERECLRCDRREYEGGERELDISDALLASLSRPVPFLGEVQVASPMSIIWVDDRLNPVPWRP